MFNCCCWLKFAAVAICLGLSSGCGRSVHVVEGQVILNGKPLERGAIDFEPTDNRGRLFGGDIRSGSYRIEIPAELATGTATVRIVSPQPTGRKLPAGPPAPPDRMVDEIQEAIPANYNTRSTLQVDLSQAGRHDFDLSSPPR